MTCRSVVLSISIDCPLEVVTRYLANPRNFPDWASGLAVGLTPRNVHAHSPDEAAEWIAETPLGQATIRFSPPNEFGVADHWVLLPDGTSVYVPMRAVANAEGSEVSLTLFRIPGMDQARFMADADWVRRDLSRLKLILEARGDHDPSHQSMIRAQAPSLKKEAARQGPNRE